MKYGEQVLGLSVMRLSTFNPFTGTVGTSITLEDPQLVEFTPETGSDQIDANLRVSAAAGWIKAYKIKIDWGNISRDALKILLGNAYVLGAESGTSPNKKQDATMKAGVLFPRFAMAGFSQGVADSGLVVAAANCQITGIGQMSKAEDGKFWLSKFEGMVLHHDGDLLRMSYQETSPATFDDVAFQALFA